MRSELDPEDLERLACAAHLLGRNEESAELWVRAHREYERRGAPARAARCAYWLAVPLLLNGELARGGGWLSRGQRLLADAGGECVEQGYLLLPAGIRAFLQNDAAAAHAAFEEAARIGERYGDRELTTLARQGQGRALIRLGQTARGVGLLDEVMVAVTAGEVSPIVVGDIYCSVLDACQEVFDLRRAQEWTAALGRWCESQPICRRIAAIVWCTAPKSCSSAAPGPTRWRRPGAPASTWPSAGSPRRPARPTTSSRSCTGCAGSSPRLRRITGRPAAAAASRNRGWPCCGWRRARSRPRATAIAGRSTRRAPPRRRPASSPPPWRSCSPPATSRRRAAAADELSALAAAARGAAASERRPRTAHGAVLLASGDARAALAALRRAWAGWREVDAPYEAARARVLIGLACRALGDEDAAAMELDAAARRSGSSAPGPTWRR